MDGLEIRRKRALYRAGHRGMKELDLMLGRFAEERIPQMDDASLTAFEQLLALPDPEIDQWLRGKPPPEGVALQIAAMRAFFGMHP